VKYVTISPQADYHACTPPWQTCQADTYAKRWGMQWIADSRYRHRGPGIAVCTVLGGQVSSAPSSQGLLFLGAWTT